MIHNPQKICLIVDCLSKGGAEKIAAFLSHSFHKHQYQVAIISLRDDISYNYAGKLFNLGKNEPKNKLLKQLRKFYLFRKYYKQVDASVYIDFRIRSRFLMELMLHLFVFKTHKMVMTIHSSRIFYYFPKHKIFNKFYKKAKAIVAVSENVLHSLKAVYDFKNLHFIPNLYSQEIIGLSDAYYPELDSMFFLAVGRLDNETKQFNKLILAYKESLPFKNNIPLVILGEGKDGGVLKQLVEDEKLQEKIKLIGFVNNPYPYMKQSKCLLLSSKFEGFGMVLVESLAIGTPVISFDCKTGPSEIIQNKKNGLLVKDQDFEALIQAINMFYNNDELYNECKKNAYRSTLKFSDKVVFKQWLNLINS